MAAVLIIKINDPLTVSRLDTVFFSVETLPRDRAWVCECELPCVYVCTWCECDCASPGAPTSECECVPAGCVCAHSGYECVHTCACSRVCEVCRGRRTWLLVTSGVPTSPGAGDVLSWINFPSPSEPRMTQDGCWASPSVWGSPDSDPGSGAPWLWPACHLWRLGFSSCTT